MNIAIIDRCIDQEDSKARAEKYKTILEARGHVVTAVNNVLALPGLESFDVAIAHPTSEDAKLLLEETKRREEFRVILHTVDPGEYPDLFHRESTQVCSFFSITHKEKIIPLIEEGW